MIGFRDVITEARQHCRKTPVTRGGAQLEAGVNCIGFAAAVAKALGLEALWQAFAPYEGLAAPPQRRFLLRALAKHLEVIPKHEAGPGCLLLIQDDPEDATHVALVSYRGPDGSLTIIEAAGRQVDEHQLSARPVLRAYRIPGVDYG